MKELYVRLMWIFYVLILGLLTFLASCNSDDPEPDIGLTGSRKIFNVNEVDGSGINGTITFEEREDNSTLVTVQLSGTTEGVNHPNHIHRNSIAESGDIYIPLTNIDGTTGTGETVVASLVDGTKITFSELIAFDGHINVHLSESDFSNIIAAGEIGGNVLTGDSETYPLNGEGVEGTIMFEKRESGESLATITVTGAPTEADHPAHIHSNSEVEGGEIILTFNNLDASKGTSYTHIASLDDATPVTYDELINIDGHVKVHRSEADFSQIASGDIGANALTGESMELNLRVPDSFTEIGTAAIFERKNGTSLVSIRMNDNGDHPSHIHENSRLEGGSIVITFNNVVNGKSDNQIEKDDLGNEITFSQLMDIDGHIIVHNSNADFSVIASTDIGQNALTGERMEYEISEVGASGVSGIATLEERKNGSTIVTMDLEGTTPGVLHPNHIHENSNVEGGSVVITFTNINGDTGWTETNISAMDDGTAITYDELVEFDGHFKIHKSASDFSIVAEGDAGGNVLTGESVVYQISQVNGSGVSGTATFAERKSGFTLITLAMQGTYNSHPAHIHQNNIATGGSIVIGFNNVNGTTGLSINDIDQLDNGESITYQELINYNGHIRVHDSDANFSAIAEGDIGSNAN